MNKSMAEYVAELEARKAKVLEMGGADKVARQHARGRLTARERVDALVDPGSFVEIGMLAHSDVPDAEARTPAEGKVCGIARVDGRMVAVKAADATIYAGATGRIGSRKMVALGKLAFEKGYPLLLLDEGGGVRIPDILGSDGIVSNESSPGEYAERHRCVPMLTAILGDGYGETAWDAAFADFVVQLKGSCMAVSSPRALEVATSEQTTEEDLGGWEVHAKATGLVDVAYDDDTQCLAAMKRFLSYMPSHAGELPPLSAGDPDAASRQHRLEEVVPIESRRAYDMHKVLEVLFDRDSVFELKPLLDRSAITALARLAGRPVGVLASNPMHSAGALGLGACHKMTAFIVMCDSFNIPIVTLCDTPGFFVGRKAEEGGIPGKIVTQWTALHQASVPRACVVLRKGYGGGYFSFGAHGMGMDFNFSWPTGDMGFVAPDVATNIAHRRRIEAAADPEALRAQLTEEMRASGAPWRAAGKMYLHDVIGPRDTRATLISALEIASGNKGGFSKRRLANWPTSF